MTGNMALFSNLLFIVAVAFYSLGVLASLWVFITRKKEWVGAIPALTVAGFLVHFGAIAMRGVEEGGFPANDLREILFLLAWAAISVYLFAHFKFRIEVMGVLILPLVVALMLATLLIPRGPASAVASAAVPPAGGLEGAVRMLHIVPAILGVSALFLTFASSIMYLVQERALKTHRPIKFFLKLPSLEKCEKLGHQSLTWGFSLLSFVVVTGVISAGYGAHGHEDWQIILREKWSLLAWLIFAVVMYDRIFSGGWRGRKAAYLSILGFGVMILRMIGV